MDDLEEKPCKRINVFWKSPHPEHEWNNAWDEDRRDAQISLFWCPGRPALEEAPR